MAVHLCSKILEPSWTGFPRNEDDKRLSVRMIVFARRDAKGADKRAFIRLEHVLEWIRNRMKPGEVCSPYERSDKFSPWRGATRVVVDFLDASQPRDEDRVVS
jgi:hypothetical protein